MLTLLLLHWCLNQTLKPKNNNHGKVVEIKILCFNWVPAQLLNAFYILIFFYILHRWNINATYLVFFQTLILNDLLFNTIGSLLFNHLSVTELKELGIFFLILLSFLLSFYYFLCLNMSLNFPCGISKTEIGNNDKAMQCDQCDK